MGSCASAASSSSDNVKSGASPRKSKSRVSHTSTSIHVDKSSPSKNSGRFSLAVGGNGSPIRSRTPVPQLPPQLNLPTIAHLPANVQKLICGRMDAAVQHDSRMIKIYISACVTDSHEERDILYERVYPKLRLYCAERGFEFDVIDLHWGLRDEHTDDLYLKRLCVTQLKRCKNVTQGPSLCAFVHEKVGPACPATVPAAEFDKGLKKADKTEKQLLTHWFKRDDNADPPLYVLQTVETHLPEYQDDDIDAHATACQIWTNMAAKIGEAFGRVNVKATSDLEDELEAAFGDVGLDRSSVIWVNRTFTDFHPDGSSALSYLYSDMSGGGKDLEAESRLKTLCGILHKKVDSNHTLKFTVTWKEKPLDPADNEHAQYLELMSEKVHGLLQEMIDKTIEAVLERRRKQPKTGLSDSLLSDVMHHSQICQSLATPFIGMTEVLNKLYKYITDASSPKRPLVIHGSDGSGRSSLASMIALNGCTLPEWAGSCCVLRYIRMTPSCFTIEQTLHSVCEQICALSGQHTSNAFESLSSTPEFFSALLKKTSSPIIIIIDGLDHADSNMDVDMSWVPTELPAHVRLILTTNSDHDSYTSLQEILPEADCFFEVPPLSLSDVTGIVDDLLGMERRAVTAEQQNHMIAAIKAVPNPLYARILTQMAVNMHSYSPLSELPTENTLEEQVQALFTTLENRIGAASVAGALGYLTAAQNGLTDSHMNDLLSCNEAVLHELHKLHQPAVRRAPPYFWASISTELMPFLYEYHVDGVSYLTWRHDVFREVAQERYQGSDATLHGSILDYLNGRWANGKKMPYNKDTEPKDRYVMVQSDCFGDFFNHWKLSEIAYQLYRCKKTGKLKDDCLLNVSWLKTKLQAAGPHQLLHDLSLGLHAEPSSKDLQVMYEFIQKAGYALSHDAEQFLTQVYHRCKDGKAKESAVMKKLYDQASKPSQPFLSPSKPCVRTLTSEKTGDDAEIIHEGLFRIKGDPNHMVTVSSEKGHVCVWNILSGELVRTLTGLTQPKNVKMATTENAVILCNREIHIYNLDSGTLVSKLKGVLNIKMPYYGIHDSDHTIALSRNRMYVNIMNNMSGDMVATFKVGEDRFLNSLIVSGNGQVCVCGDEVQKPFPLLVWDLVNKKLVHDLRISGHEFTTSMSDITTNGHYAVCVCKELDYPDPNFIVVYDLQSGAIFKKWQADYNTTCVAISSEGNCVISGHEGGNVIVWDLVGGSNKYTFKNHKSAPDTVCMNEAGTRCVTYDSKGADLSIRLWDVQNGESLGAFLPDVPVSSCQISASGDSVVIGLPGYRDIITLRVHTKSGPPSPKKESGVYGDASRKGKVFDVTQS